MSADVEHVTCRELVEVLTDYLEGVLEPAERADIERHIVFCRGCANYVEQMHRTIDLAGLLAGSDASQGAGDPLLELFRDWRVARAAASGDGEP